MNKPATKAELVDPVEMEIFSNRLISITDDMNNTLVRSSFSTNIKERKDCSVGLFDGRGRLIAQGTQIPLHLGSLSGAVRAVLAQFPAETIGDGDVFISNDPYLANGSHLPDINIVTPVFWEGKLRFFTANIGHHSDVGGVVPGSIAGGLRSVFAEGIRIPSCRIAKGGVDNEDLLRLICCNTRDPEERILDLRVQIATNKRGSDATKELIRQTGIEKVLRSVDDVMAYTRRRLLNRIAELKPGTYSFQNQMDDDGLGGDPVTIRVKLVVEKDRLQFDFAGSGAQARGAMNLPPNALQATVYYAVKSLLDPELPVNEGMFVPIEIVAPPGSILNPSPPAAVGARTLTAQRVAGCIFGVFRDLLPENRVMASSNDCCPAIVFSGALQHRQGEFVYLETLGGGAGARFDADGANAIHVHVTNTSNLPVEAMENEYPLLVDAYALISDSGGAGRTRGGLGIAKQISALKPGIVFSARSDGHTVSVPSGVAGGRNGRQARLVKNFGVQGKEEVLHSKAANIELRVGESVRLETSGGGGFGEPERRARSKVQRDVLDGIVSRDAARTDYGLDT